MIQWHSNDDLPNFLSELTCILFLQQADETLDFEEQILEAAKSIAAATSALVKSASAAQKELVAQGKVSHHDCSQLARPISYKGTYLYCLFQVGSSLANAEDDGQWSQGLISAVRFFLLFGCKLTEEPM